jgi:hypothetical protein
MNKPEKFNECTVGVLDIVSKGDIEYVFIHLASYLTGKEAEKIERAGHWMIEAAQYLKQSQKTSAVVIGIGSDPLVFPNPSDLGGVGIVSQRYS